MIIEEYKETTMAELFETLEAPLNPVQQYRTFFGKGEYKFAIYPSYWKDSWGKSPLLGIVHADNEFLAERLAYDRGILPTPFNCTFQPKIKNLGPVNKSKNFDKTTE